MTCPPSVDDFDFTTEPGSTIGLDLADAEELPLTPERHAELEALHGRVLAARLEIVSIGDEARVLVGEVVGVNLSVDSLQLSALDNVITRLLGGV